MRECGGLAVYGGEGLQVLPLPVAGLMSSLDGDTAAGRYGRTEPLCTGAGQRIPCPLDDIVLSCAAGDPRAETQRLRPVRRKHVPVCFLVPSNRAWTVTAGIEQPQGSGEKGSSIEDPGGIMRFRSRAKH